MDEGQSENQPAGPSPTAELRARATKWPLAYSESVVASTISLYGNKASPWVVRNCVRVSDRPS
jgi:hypothetical protein